MTAIPASFIHARRSESVTEGCVWALSCYVVGESMPKLKSVKKGWRLDAILTVKVAGAAFNKGKLPEFAPSVTGRNGEVETPGGWRGGNAWLSHTVPGPWGLPGVV